jgi:hypothetical protein
LGRDHGGELARMPDGKIGLDHIARSMPCSRANSVAIS